MTHDEMIAVIAAHRDGKTIECRVRSGCRWFEVVNIPLWTFDSTEYRIKPEPPKPREWWAVEFGHVAAARMYSDKVTAFHAGQGSGYGGVDVTPFLVREVLPGNGQ